MKISEAINILQDIQKRLSVNNIDNDPSFRINIHGCTHIQDVDSIIELSTAVVTCNSLCVCPKCDIKEIKYNDED